MATEADIQETVSLMKNEGESINLVERENDGNVDGSGLNQPLEAAKCSVQPENMQVCTDDEIENINIVIRNNAATSEDESVLKSPQAARVASEETCGVSEHSPSEEISFQVVKEISEEKEPKENEEELQRTETGDKENEVKKLTEEGAEKSNLNYENVNLAGVNLQMKNIENSKRIEDKELDTERTHYQIGEAIADKHASVEENVKSIEKEASESPQNEEGKIVDENTDTASNKHILNVLEDNSGEKEDASSNMPDLPLDSLKNDDATITGACNEDKLIDSAKLIVGEMSANKIEKKESDQSTDLAGKETGNKTTKSETAGHGTDEGEKVMHDTGDSSTEAENPDNKNDGEPESEIRESKKVELPAESVIVAAVINEMQDENSFNTTLVTKTEEMTIPEVKNHDIVDIVPEISSNDLVQDSRKEAKDQNESLKDRDQADCIPGEKDRDCEDLQQRTKKHDSMVNIGDKLATTEPSNRENKHDGGSIVVMADENTHGTQIIEAVEDSKMEKIEQEKFKTCFSMVSQDSNAATSREYVKTVTCITEEISIKSHEENLDEKWKEDLPTFNDAVDKNTFPNEQNLPLTEGNVKTASAEFLSPDRNAGELHVTHPFPVEAWKGECDKVTDSKPEEQIHEVHRTSLEEKHIEDSMEATNSRISKCSYVEESVTKELISKTSEMEIKKHQEACGLNSEAKSDNNEAGMNIEEEIQKKEEACDKETDMMTTKTESSDKIESTIFVRDETTEQKFQVNSLLAEIPMLGSEDRSYTAEENEKSNNAEEEAYEATKITGTGETASGHTTKSSIVYPPSESIQEETDKLSQDNDNVEETKDLAVKIQDETNSEKFKPEKAGTAKVDENIAHETNQTAESPKETLQNGSKNPTPTEASPLEERYSTVLLEENITTKKPVETKRNNEFKTSKCEEDPNQVLLKVDAEQSLNVMPGETKSVATNFKEVPSLNATGNREDDIKKEETHEIYEGCKVTGNDEDTEKEIINEHGPVDGSPQSIEEETVESSEEKKEEEMPKLEACQELEKISTEKDADAEEQTSESNLSKDQSRALAVEKGKQRSKEENTLTKMPKQEAFETAASSTSTKSWNTDQCTEPGISSSSTGEETMKKSSTKEESSHTKLHEEVNSSNLGLSEKNEAIGITEETLRDRTEPNDEPHPLDVTNASEETLTKEISGENAENCSLASEVCERDLKKETLAEEETSSNDFKSVYATIVTEEKGLKDAEIEYKKQVESSDLTFEEKGQATIENERTMLDNVNTNLPVDNTSNSGENQEKEIPAGLDDAGDNVECEVQDEIHIAGTEGQNKVTSKDPLKEYSTMPSEEQELLVIEANERIDESPGKSKILFEDREPLATVMATADPDEMPKNASESMTDDHCTETNPETSNSTINKATNEEANSMLKVEGEINEEQNENETRKAIILSEEDHEEACEADDSENIKEQAVEKESRINKHHQASIADEISHEVKEYSPIWSVQASESNEQIGTKISEVEDDPTKNEEASIRKESEGKVQEGRTEKLATVFSQPAKQSEITEEMQETQDCYKRSDAETVIAATAETRSGEAQRDVKVLHGLNTSSDETSLETINSVISHQATEVDSLKPGEIPLNLASQLPTNDHEHTKAETDIMENPNEQVAKVTTIAYEVIHRSNDPDTEEIDGSQKNTTVEKLDYPINDCERMKEATRNVENPETDETEKMKFIADAANEFENHKTAENDETAGSQRAEKLDANEIAEGEEASKTVADHKIQSVEAVKLYEGTDYQTIPAEKLAEQLQSPSSELLSEEQEQRTSSTVVKIKEEKPKEAETLENESHEAHFAAKINEEISSQKEQSREIETVYESKRAPDQTLPVDISEETSLQKEKIEETCLQNEQIEETCLQKGQTREFELVNEEKPADQMLPEKTSDAQVQTPCSTLPSEDKEHETPTEEIGLQKGQTREFEIVNKENPADQIFQEETSDAQVQTPSSTLPSGEQEHKTSTEAKKIEEEIAKKLEIVEDETSGGYGAVKTTEDIGSKGEVPNGVEASGKDENTADQIIPSEKPEEQLQTSAPALPSEEQEQRTKTIAEKTEKEKIDESNMPENESREDSFSVKAEEKIMSQKEEPKDLEAVQEDESIAKQTVPEETSDMQLYTPSFTSDPKEHEQKAEVKKMEEENNDEEQMLDDASNQILVTAKTIVEFCQQKEESMDLAAKENNSASDQALSADKGEEENLLENEKQEENFAAKATEEKFSQKEEPKIPPAVKEEEDTAEQTTPEEISDMQLHDPSSTLPFKEEEQTTATKVEEIEEEKKKEETMLENESHQIHVTVKTTEEFVQHKKDLTDLAPSKENESASDQALVPKKSEEANLLEKGSQEDSFTTKGTGETSLQMEVPNNPVPVKEEESTAEETVPETSDMQLHTPSSTLPTEEQKHRTTTKIEEIEEKKGKEEEMLESQSHQVSVTIRTQEEVFQQKEEPTDIGAAKESESAADQAPIVEKSEEECQPENDSQEDSFTAKTTEETFLQIGELKNPEAVTEQESNVEWTLPQETDMQLHTPASTLLPQEQEKRTTTKVEKIEEEKRKEEVILEYESHQVSASGKTTEDYFQQKKEPADLGVAKENKSASDQAFLPEKSNEANLPEKSQEDSFPAKETEDTFFQVEELKHPEGFKEEENTTEQTLPEETSDLRLHTPSSTLPPKEPENTTTVTVEKIEEEEMPGSENDQVTVTVSMTEEFLQKEEPTNHGAAKANEGEDDQGLLAEKSEQVNMPKHESQEESSTAKATEETFLQMEEPKNPEAAEKEEEMTSVWTLPEETTDMQIHTPFSTLPPKEQEQMTTTKVENIEEEERKDKEMLGSESHQVTVTVTTTEELCPQKEEPTDLGAAKENENADNQTLLAKKLEKANPSENESQQDSFTTKATEKTFLQMEEPENPEAVKQDEKTAEQKLPEETLDMRLHTPDSTLPPKEQAQRTTTKVEKIQEEERKEEEMLESETHQVTFTAMTTEELGLQKEPTDLGAAQENESADDQTLLIEKSEEAHQPENESKDSFIAKTFSQMEEPRNPEAVKEEERTAKQTLPEETLDLQLHTSDSTMLPKEEAQKTTTIVEKNKEGTRQVTVTMVTTEEPSLQKEESADLGAAQENESVDDQALLTEKSEEVNLPENESREESLTAKAFLQMEEPKNAEVVKEGETAEQTLPKETLDMQLHTPSSTLPPKEHEESTITEVEKIEGEKRKEEMLESESQEVTVTAMTTEELFLQKEEPTYVGAAKENERANDQAILKEKSEEANLIENGYQEDSFAAKATEEMFLQMEEPKNPEAVMGDEDTGKQTLPEETADMQLQTSSSTSPPAEQKQETSIVEQTEKKKSNEEEESEQVPSTVKTAKEFCLQNEQTADLTAAKENESYANQTLVAEQFQTPYIPSPCEEQQQQVTSTIEKIEKKKPQEVEAEQDQSQDHSFAARTTEKTCMQKEESKGLEITPDQTISTGKSGDQLETPCFSLPPEEYKHGIITTIAKIEGAKNENEKMPKDESPADSSATKRTEESCLQKEELSKPADDIEYELTPNLPAKEAKEPFQTPLSAFASQENNYGTTATGREIEEEGPKEAEINHESPREASAAHITGAISLSKEESSMLQVPNSGIEIIKDIQESSAEVHEDRDINPDGNSKLEAEEREKETNYAASRSESEKTTEQATHIAEPSNLDIEPSERPFEFEPQMSHEVLTKSEDHPIKEKCHGAAITDSKPKENQSETTFKPNENNQSGVSSGEMIHLPLHQEITEKKEVADTSAPISLCKETMKENRQEEELNAKEYLQEKLSAETKEISASKEIQKQIPSEETAAGDADQVSTENGMTKESLIDEAKYPDVEDAANRMDLEDHRVETNFDNVMTKDTTTGQEESDIEMSQKEGPIALGKASEITQDIRHLDKTIPVASNNQNADHIDSTETITSTGNEYVPPVLQDKVAEILQKAEIEEQAPGNVEGVHSEEKELECGEEKRINDSAEKTTEKSTLIDSPKNSLSDLLQRSTGETLQVAKHETEERHPMTSKEGTLIEVETTQVTEAKADEEKDEEEGDENKKTDSGSDALVMVAASRNMDNKVAHKKSHNILSGVGSKVKHSISKVKKAITGKSSHPKSISPK